MVTTMGVGAEDGRRRTAKAFVKHAEKEMDQWVDSIGKAACGLGGVIGKNVAGYLEDYEDLNRNGDAESDGLDTDDGENMLIE